MKVYINEDKLHLLEGKDRKQQARAKTKKVIRNYFGENNAMLDQPNDMTNGLTLVDFLEQEVMHDFFHSRNRADAKGYFVCLEPMVANIILHVGWQQDRPDDGTIARLEQILNYIEELYNKGELDPRTISLDSTINTLNQQFGTAIDERNTKENEELNSKEFVQNENYTIIDDVDFEQANEIGDYSYSEQPLCYTHHEDTWIKSFHGDINKVYVCLTKDWKSVKEVHSESLLPQYPNSNAYDKYGLSMIFIFVDLEGELVFSNTRWNHEADYGNGRSVDHAFTKTDLSELLGVNFNTRFVGYTEDELKAKGIKYVSFKNVQKLLDQGIAPNELFDYVDDFRSGFASVSLNDKWNFINAEGHIISDTWFDRVGIFNNGFACVKLGNKWHTIDANGKIDVIESVQSKKIYVNKGKLSLLKENIENDLTSFIMDKVYAHQTSLSYTDMFPEVEGESFMYSILQKRFNDVKENLLKFQDIKSTDEEYLITYLSKLITKAKELEQPIETKLVKVCENIITSLFDIPEDMVIFNCKLVGKIEPKEGAVRMMPEDKETSDEFDFSQLNTYTNIKSLISKRRIINSLIQGASYELGTMFELYDIDNQLLIEIYKRIIAINDFILFTVKEKVSDKNPKQGAYVEVLLAREGEKTEIHSQGIIFPLLVIETIRGFFELFASHGLPKDNELAREVISHSDFLLAEPWDLRFGVELWNMVTHGVKNTKVLPYYFSNLCTLHNEEFKQTFKEILNGDSQLNNELIDKSNYDFKYNQFTDYMQQKNADYNVITDDITNAEDLDQIELKEDHRQLSIPFDGNHWKYNYEYFIDYLEKIGKYGTLPPCKNKYDDYFNVGNEIDETDLLDYITLDNVRDYEIFQMIYDYFQDKYDKTIAESEEHLMDVEEIVKDFDNIISHSKHEELKVLFDENGNWNHDRNALADLLFSKMNKNIRLHFYNDFIMEVFDKYCESLENDTEFDYNDYMIYSNDVMEENNLYKECLRICKDGDFNDGMNGLYEKITDTFKDFNMSSFPFRRYLSEKLKENFLEQIYLDFDENGLLRIERGLNFSYLLNKPDDLKNSLYKKSYEQYDGIGNCWSWQKGSARSYCVGLDDGNNTKSIVLVGKVNPKDINWIESCRLFYIFNEDEVRIEHNSLIEIDEIYIDEGDRKHLPLPKPIVVKSGTDY